MALFQKRIEGDDSLLRLAQLRFREAGLGAEFYASTADELERLWEYRPSLATRTTPVMVHLDRALNLLEEPSRALILDFAARFAGRVSGLVVHDQVEMASKRDEYLLASREVSVQLEKIENSPRLFIEYAAGLDPAHFAKFFQLLREDELICACIDIGHVGIWQARNDYSRSHPGEDICNLKPSDPRLATVVDDVQRAVRSSLAAVVDLTEAVGQSGKPLHLHLHDGHPLSTFSPYGISDHLSFLARIPIPFEHDGKYSLDPMYGPARLASIVSKAVESFAPDSVSFTLEIHPTDGRLALGNASALFSHWRDKTNAERMNYWLSVLLENHVLVEQALDAALPRSQGA